jgi:hypothetical protein
MLLTRLRWLVAALWAGSLWTVGYLVAPTLFAILPDRMLAGSIAGAMFRHQAWLSVACALLLLALLQWGANELAPARRRGLMLTALAMLACTLTIQLGIQPLMASLREAAGPAGIGASPQSARFGMLHGVSSVMYLIQSVLAGFLIARQ